MDISVVIPVYNGAAQLGDCVASVDRAVRALTPAERTRVEVVVCDNHSTDDSLVIARAARFDCASRVVQPPRHEENRTRNWAFGLEQGGGTWLMMLHHDDLMAVGGLVAQLRAIASGRDGVVMVTGRHRTFEDPLRPGRARPGLAPRATIAGRALRERVLPLHCPFVPFVLFRRATYEAVGGLDERWQLVQDWELWIRLLGQGDLYAHGDEVGWWRQHPTSSGYRLRNAREHVELARELPGLVPSLSARTLTRARSTALARAALQLHEVDPLPPGAVDWLAGDRLPTVDAARRRLAGVYRRVAAIQAGLRLAGVGRR